jgi:hypothetical protein
MNITREGKSWWKLIPALLVIGVIAVLCVCQKQAVAQDEKAAEAKLLAKLPLGTDWYGVYIQGNKTGCLKQTAKLEEKEGEKTYVFLQEIHLKITRGNMKMEMKMKIESKYSGKAPYKLLYRKEEQDLGVGGMTIVGSVEGEKFKITSEAMGMKQERLVEEPKETLLDSTQGALLALRGAKVGEKKKRWEYEMQKARDKEYTLEVTKIEEKVSRGIKFKVYTITEASDEVTITSKYSSDGKPLKMEASFFTFRLEEEKLAKDFGYGFDGLLDTLVKTEKLGKKPGEVKELKLKVSGLKKDMALSSPRQKFEKKGDGVYELTLTMDEKPAPITDLGDKKDELKEYLKATHSIQSDNEEIVKTAKKIVGEEKDLYKKAVLINEWVHKNITGSLTTNLPTALDVLKKKAGDCSEYTLLFVALARAAGIPAREVRGVMYIGDELSGFGFHAWPEIYVGKWIGIDPAWNEPLLDATHIRLCDAQKEAKLLQLMGSMKIEIKSVK